MKAGTTTDDGDDSNDEHNNGDKYSGGCGDGTGGGAKYSKRKI